MILSILLNLALAPQPPAHPAPLFLQDEQGSSQSEAQEQFRQLVEYYQPTNSPAEELAFTLSQLAATSVAHKIWAGEGSYTFSSPRFIVYGETILIQDSRNEMTRTLEMVRGLDQAYTPDEGGKRRRSQSEPHELLQYRLKSIGMDAVRRALQGFDRQMSQPGSKGVIDISYGEERGLLVLRGPASDVAAVKSVLDEMDVPLPQVLITCYIVGGTTKEENDVRVPADLARDLSALVPYSGFELVSTGLLRSDTASTMDLQVELAEGSGQFQLDMRPRAFDPDTQTLTLDSVRFQMQVVIEGQHRNRSFSTSTSLQTDQYTVLGAVGSDPVFVVIEMTRVD